jgi:hypothetical protein
MDEQRKLAKMSVAKEWRKMPRMRSLLMGEKKSGSTPYL